ncbi:hypothetical protein Poli38472_011187 [Pythium oligandrum]|uniref:Uncharacterized protein n=1 Tax=Pythium oligandrum TaxID=41045 RepID=A0A8K1CPU1_PYTOL|nr:hypothetical protein Poli38472_011187 [Pythium oligandrum]|eukprot:TMW67567.1 hypothetical protein Poli38472_011187 [Pythium oligandrum]
MATIISTPLFPEPEAYYARYSLTPEELEGLIRVRTVETDSNSQVVWSDILVAVFCPCVSIAQIASSTGSSYFVSLLVFASIYLSGLGFLIQSVMEYMECDLNAEVVLYAVGLEIAAFVVGPYVSLSTVGSQITPSIGCSYFVTVIVFALIYLTGLGFLLKSVMEYTVYDLNEEVVFYAIGLEFAAYLVGPYISFPTVGCVWFWHSLAEGLDDTDRIRIIAPAVYYYACVDGWLDVAFVLAAAYIRDNLRDRVNAPERRCCQHCLTTCCIWATLAKGVSSAKSYAIDYGSWDVGPLDVIPAYEGSRI